MGRVPGPHDGPPSDRDCSPAPDLFSGRDLEELGIRVAAKTQFALGPDGRLFGRISAEEWFEYPPS